VKIPKRVKIGADDIRVKFKNTVKCADGESVLGISKGSVGRIEIAKRFNGENVTESTIADTFLHEIFHILNANMGINLKERQVAGIAGGLLMVIRDNDLDFRK